MIGVVGATGDVGSHTVRVLDELGLGRMRLGGRREVDYRDDSSLDRFAAGCQVLVNCAGPSHLVGARVARAALRANAAYVDASSGANSGGADGREVLGAGLRPGLAGLLPRWLARHEFDSVHGLMAHVAVFDRFTATAASDYLNSVDGEPLTAWRRGMTTGTLTRRTGVVLPFLPGAVALLPYLGSEEHRLAESLRLEQGDWYTAISGDHVRLVVDRARTLDHEEAVEALVLASSLDLMGRRPHAVLAVRLTGVRSGEAITRTVVLRGRCNGEMTGAITALAVLAVVCGEVPPGSHAAAEVLDPELTIKHLADLGVALPLVVDGDLLVEEEG